MIEGMSTVTYVYDFSEGSKDQKDLLGGKGANLAEMSNLGLPVPPGFTISTEACRAYLERGHEPEGLAEEVTAHLRTLEEAMGKRLGQVDDPLLVSVRSGAKFSMPGMMETVLNVGLNDESVKGLAAQAGGNERFAVDSYRRLLQMFGSTVLGIEARHFHEALDALKDDRGVGNDLELGVEDLDELVTTYKKIVAEHSDREFPQDPREQLDMAVRAVFESWNTERAVLYRRQERIPTDLGTAVNIVSMVFGNGGDSSGTGVAFTRDPASGAQGIYGDYLQNAQGEDVVAGIRNTVPLGDLERIDKRSYDELLAIMEKLELHYKDLCDIEFTIEHGKLWMLQTRVGKRTAEAAFRIACQLVDQGLIDEDEAVRRVTGAQLAQLMFPRFDRDAERDLIATGMNASPGAAVGKVVFDSETAVEWSERGEDVILVRRETNPDDLRGMVAARGILTSRGGKTSHAAVVARGMGRTCVCGADGLDVDARNRRLRTRDGRELDEGDVISIDGTTGEVFAGEVPVVDSLVVRYFEGHDDALDDELVAAVARLMGHADDTRRLAVRANADTPDDALRARRFGAQGIGLCRTEHMFLGDRKKYVETLILAETPEEQEKALAALLPLQRDDFVGILEAMDGLPVTIRLIDPPLHEFLPDYTDLSVEVALHDERGARDTQGARAPRGGAPHPRDQPDAGAARRAPRHRDPRPVRHAGQGDPRGRGAAGEGRRRPASGDHDPAGRHRSRSSSSSALDIEQVARSIEEDTGVRPDFQVGTMIELPRAVMAAGEIAESGGVLLLRHQRPHPDDVGLLARRRRGVLLRHLPREVRLRVSPFESLDVDGVGALVSLAVERGRATRPDLHLGVCGEHGGDPDSIHFFDDAGLDYVSCSPFRVPVARLEAGRSGASGSDSA